MRSRFARPLLLLSAAVACGGQSGNEGELPAAPCARSQPTVVGRIEALGEGCVSVRVERVVQAGDPVVGHSSEVILEGPPMPGSVLRGYLDATYAWRHAFAAEDPVAVVVSSRGDMLSLQLLPVEDVRVQAQWGKVQLQFTLDDLIAPDCQTKLEAEHLQHVGDDVIEGGSGTRQTLPPAAEPDCRP
jgi:hypothetical protein